MQLFKKIKDREPQTALVTDLKQPEDSNSEVPMEKSNKRVFALSLIVTIVIIVLTGALFYIRNLQIVAENELQDEDVEVVRNTSGPEKISESQNLARNDIRLEILNGSGVAGNAAKVKTEFEALGYDQIAIGNTDLIDGNRLLIKVGIEDKVDVLVGDFNAKLGVASISGELTSGDIDARIILGR